MSQQPNPTLTDDQVRAFREEGFHVFPGYFSDDEMAPFKADMDRLEELRAAGGRVPWMVEFPNLWQLIVHPRTLGAVQQVMGEGFAFHHLHASVQQAGTRGVHWHQDYEQVPQTNRSHVMVHVFYYFNGLNGEVGDLVFLPRSQNAVVGNDALRILGEHSLPGEVVVDDLPPGSAVMVHSALWHARRTRPGGQDRPRYFADASYCQAGVRWPSYHNAAWRDMLAIARTNLGDADPRLHLFREEHFFDAREAHAALRQVEGSLIEGTR